MRMLLDECVPAKLASALPEHFVRTVPQMGWAGVKNGRLVQLLVAEHFEVFITTDQNLSYQQNLPQVPVAVVALKARTNRLSDLLPLMDKLREALPRLAPGQVHVIE